MASQDTYSEEHLVEFKKKARKKASSGEMNADLNINSMMDIMTILLVFLLISVTSDPLAITEGDLLKFCVLFILNL